MPIELHPENLRPCQKGHTNNPNGRPKGKSMTTILKQLMNQKMPVDKNPLTKELIKSGRLQVREVFILSQIAQAMKGNSAISKEIWERLDGKISQHIEADIKESRVDLSKLTENELKIMNEITKKIDG